MVSKFVETKVIETKVIETKVIQHVEDGYGPCCTLMSVIPRGRGLRLVIGAAYKDNCAAALNKSGLGELIEILKDIHSAME